MLSVREERTVVGGVELARKTVIAATDEGIVTHVTETRRDVDLPGSVPAVMPPSAPPALPCPQTVVVVKDSPPSSDEFSWVDCCFKCGGDEWYSLDGKGFCVVLLLLLGYLIAGALFLAYLLACCVLACLSNTDCD